MDWFWHVLWVCLVVIPIALLWIAIVVELFRRNDLSGWMKLLWLLFVLVFPVIGAITYVIVTWLQADRARDLGAAPESPSGTPPSSVADLARLDRLRRSGVLSEEEFQAGRRAVLEGTATDPAPAEGTGGTP
jgi:Phospholipase_D-nuclease N-terminal